MIEIDGNTFKVNRNVGGSLRSTDLEGMSCIAAVPSGMLKKLCRKEVVWPLGVCFTVAVNVPTTFPFRMEELESQGTAGS